MKIKSVVLWMGLVASSALGAGTEDQASAIIRYGEVQLRGNSTQAMMLMTIHKPGYTRSLKIRSWTTGDKRALVEILEPVKEEGISSLRVDDQMWNYLPKTDQVVRVPTSLMLQSWMGSDFTNDDLMKSSSLLRDYRHRIVGYKQLAGMRVALIECQPKPGAPVVWGKVVYYARMKDRLPLKQMFYDEHGKWVRTLQFSQFRKMDDRIIPTQVKVVLAESNEETTTIVYQKVLYDRVIEENVFNRDLLRRAVENGKTLASGWSHKPMPGRLHSAVSVRATARKS